MSGSSSNASAHTARTQGAIARGYYRDVLPALRNQYGLLNRAISEGGEPDYVRDAYAGARTGLTESALLGDAAQTRAMLSAMPDAEGGPMPITGSHVGSKIADLLWNSKVNEGMGRIEQLGNLQAMALGQVGQVGGAGLQATANELRNISMMPNYNPTYATVLGLANTGGALYGAYQDWAAGQGGSLLQPLPASTTFSQLHPQGRP